MPSLRISRSDSISDSERRTPPRPVLGLKRRIIMLESEGRQSKLEMA
jgi:hypothetical protein